MDNKIEVTGRGFSFFDFMDTYGSECSIQESSAIVPRIWLGVDKHFNPENVGSSRMHLNREQAYIVGQMCLYFARHGEFPAEVPKVPEKYREQEEE